MQEAIWLRNLEEALTEMQEIPLWGSPPPFPWDTLSEYLQKTLDQPSLSLSYEKTEWIPGSELTKSYGENPLIQPFVLSPLPAPLFLILSESGKESLTTQLVTKQTPPKGIVDPSIQEGFLHFLFLQTCHLFNQMSPFGSLSASLAEKSPLPEEGAMAIEVAVTLNQTTFPVRILIPRESYASFKTQFERERPPLLTNPELRHTPMSLSIEAGSTTLSVNSFEKVEVGDFILLDRCTYDLEKKKGTALLSLASHPLFDVRIKGEEVKMLEYALTQEDPSMSRELPPEDDLIPPTPSSPEIDEEEEPLWSAESGEEKKEDLLSKKEIPLTLTVELSRFQMPLEKLTELQPGNLLDLQLSPELGVHLTVGGKRVAKGELVKMGEMIGVKILSLGE